MSASNFSTEVERRGGLRRSNSILTLNRAGRDGGAPAQEGARAIARAVCAATADLQITHW